MADHESNAEEELPRQLGGAETEAEPALVVVGIGASAGGLEAIREFFAAMPPVENLAFVVIQHLDPDKPSRMAEILRKCTPMPVKETADAMRFQGGSVYTIPPGKFLVLRDGQLRLVEPVKQDGVKLPIDFFFRSMAIDLHDRAVGVVLSGTGSDGTQGLRAVRGAGGMAMVQDPETSRFDGMPRSAIATNIADYILPPKEMPQALLRYLGYSGSMEPSLPSTEDTPRIISAILNLVASRSRSDFHSYKKSTIHRRIERRMGLRQVRGLQDYFQLLRDDPEEIASLAKDMLIGVTSFFRDPEAFDLLRERVLALLVQAKRANENLRVWVPACATGEEAYSIAMLAQEELWRARTNCRLQMFASDLDPDSLQTARDGLYPEGIVAEIPEPLLAKFFVKKDQTYQVDKGLRESIVFTRQNLLFDPPFSRIDLVSCRNLLIYLEPDAQRRVLALLAFAVNPGGYLFLGKSDSIGGQTELFEVISQQARLYRRTGAPGPPIAGFRRTSDSLAAQTTGRRTAEKLDRDSLAELNQQAILEHFAAAVVLVNARGDILHLSGPSGRYFDPPSGPARLNLFTMLRGNLTASMRMAIHAAMEKEQTTSLPKVEFGPSEARFLAKVTVMPIARRNAEEELLAVIFEELPAPVLTSAPMTGESQRTQDEPSAVAQLEHELRLTKEDHLAAVEQLETANEELRITNEEMLSINEELQSANEELETSKEELQSINEELNTVNNELAEKITELTEANNDLANLFSASDLATIFVDLGLRIKRFSPPAARLVNLLSADLGRPLGHIAHNLLDVDLVAEATRVRDNLGTVEKEVQARDGSWHILRALPYRTLDHRIAGVVLSFAEVTRLKQAEEELQGARVFAESIVNTVRQPLIVLDGNLRVVSANPAFYRLFQTLPQEAEGRLIYDLGNQQWSIPELRRLLEEVIPSDFQFSDLEVEHAFRVLGQRTMLLNARRIDQPGGRARLILLVIEDATDRKRQEQAVLQLNQALRDANRELEAFVYSVSHDLRTPLRGMDGLSLALLEDYADKLDGQGRKYLEQLHGSAKRMGAMVEDLLRLSQIARTEVHRQPVDLSALVREVAEELRLSEPEREVTFAIQDGFAAEGDSRLLRIALENLLGNAWKFTAKRSQARIEFAVIEQDGQPVYCVRDNGAGFDEAYAGKLFGVFQRLHTADEFEGTGVGLAIVQRIVQRHGGRIWAEGKVDQGASFYFTLP